MLGLYDHQGGVQEAYEAAAWHPNPAVQEDRDGTLPPEDVGFLASVLLTEQKPSPVHG